MVERDKLERNDTGEAPRRGKFFFWCSENKQAKNCKRKFFGSIEDPIYLLSIYVPHSFGFSHTCVVKSTYYTGSSCVAFTTQVCFIAHTCGNNQTCVENPHRQVLGFFHTCLVKHTQRLISPWTNGDNLRHLWQLRPTFYEFFLKRNGAQVKKFSLAS